MLVCHLLLRIGTQPQEQTYPYSTISEEDTTPEIQIVESFELKGNICQIHQ